MMSQIIVLVGSSRKGGNTDLLACSFAKGTGKSNEVELISVEDYKVQPCIGCNSCFKREGHSCFQKDDMGKIYDNGLSAQLAFECLFMVNILYSESL